MDPSTIDAFDKPKITQYYQWVNKTTKHFLESFVFRGVCLDGDGVFLAAECETKVKE